MTIKIKRYNKCHMDSLGKAPCVICMETRQHPEMMRLNEQGLKAAHVNQLPCAFMQT